MNKLEGRSPTPGIHPHCKQPLHQIFHLEGAISMPPPPPPPRAPLLSLIIVEKSAPTSPKVVPGLFPLSRSPDSALVHISSSPSLQPPEKREPPTVVPIFLGSRLVSSSSRCHLPLSFLHTPELEPHRTEPHNRNSRTMPSPSVSR